MDILIKVIQLFLCFTLLVGIHELGHFFMARAFKIRVEKFYIFFNPWFSLFKFRRNGTEYGLGWLPLGGYVKIAGMVDESMDKEQMKQPVKPDEFRAKPAWPRFLVMIAGVTMNLLLAVVIYIGICYTWGDSYFSNNDARWGYNFNDAGHEMGFRDGDRFVTIDGEPVDNIRTLLNDLLITESGRTVVVERGGEQVAIRIPLETLIRMRQEKAYDGLFTLPAPFIVDSVASAAARDAGLQPGDRIAGLDGRTITDFASIREALAEVKVQTTMLTVIRDTDTLSLAAAVDGQGKLGVLALASPYTMRTRHYTFGESIPAGIRKTGEVVSDYWQQLKLIVQPKTRMYEEVGGFVAIGSIFPGEWDWQDFWFKTAFLSIILAIMNLLPIPVLDGGHALFTLYTIRYFQFEGDGTLKMDNGITFLPNDRYLLENEKFRLYYTAQGDEAHNFIVVVEDNFSNSYELEFDFNNRNVKDDGTISVVPIGNFKPLLK